MRKMIMMIVAVSFTAFLLVDAIVGQDYAGAVIGPMETAEKARILEVHPKAQGEDLKIQILTGEYKGKTITIDNNYYHSDYYVDPFQESDRIIISVNRSENPENPGVAILNYERDIYSLGLAVIFFALLIMVGRKQGLKSAVSLILTIFIIIKVMIPLILNGYNPVFSAVGCCMIISILSLIIITGISLKSVATLFGTSFGVIMAGILAYLVGDLSRFSGLSDEDTMLLMYVNQGSFDLTGILFSGIIIGTLGAVMDVSMSISSSMYEIRQNTPEIPSVQLIKSGLNIGKDVMGTMADTLILAYAGTAIPLLLFSIHKGTPLIILMNSEMISAEILRALSGSIGIILSIPATSLIFALILRNRQITGIAKYEVNLRSSPGMSGNIIGRIANKEKLDIIDQNENWYRVKRKHGETGWVRSDGISTRRLKICLSQHKINEKR